MKYSFERIFILFFLIVIVGVVILGIVNYNANRSYFESTGWVEHTNEVMRGSTLVLSTLQDMGVRGYITTGDTSFLENYHNAEKVLMPRMDALQALTRDNKSQQERVDSLRAYAMARIAISQKYIALTEQKKINDAALA